MTAGLTTHVLDTSKESPAAGVTVTLQSLKDSGETKTITQAVTNDDGRVDEPLLGPDEMESGTYQLLFDVGEYYGEGTSFLNTVPVRFIIDDVEEHYHVPLLLSPGGYTTYRGS
jgi:5-hydroxyisourate hydrolase